MRRQLNPGLQIDGILLTMVDNRTKFNREMSELLRNTYGGALRVFSAEIPFSVRAKEMSAEGKSIYLHDPGGKVAAAYNALTDELLSLEHKRARPQPER